MVNTICAVGFFIHYLDKVATVCKEILASLAEKKGEQLYGAVQLEFSVAVL